MGMYKFKENLRMIQCKKINNVKIGYQTVVIEI